MAITISAARRKAGLDAMCAGTPANSGKLRIYTGSKPADADAAIGAVTLLAELVLNSTAFTTPSSSASTDYTITAGAITQDASADNTGTAAWFRIWQSDGTTPILDGTVTATGGGGDLQLGSTSIVATGTVSVTSLTVTLPK